MSRSLNVHTDSIIFLGFEDAFEVLHQTGEGIRGGQWFGECFIALSRSGKVNVYAGDEVCSVSLLRVAVLKYMQCMTMHHVDSSTYFMGYLPREGKLVLMDRYVFALRATSISN